MITKFSESQIETIAKHTYRRIVESMTDVGISLIGLGYTKTERYGNADDSYKYKYWASIHIKDWKSRERVFTLAKIPEYDVGISIISDSRGLPVVNFPYMGIKPETCKQAIELMKKSNPKAEISTMTIKGIHKNLPILFNIDLDPRNCETILYDKADFKSFY